MAAVSPKRISTCRLPRLRVTVSDPELGRRTSQPEQRHMGFSGIRVPDSNVLAIGDS
jgi:hypothetical protein